MKRAAVLLAVALAGCQAPAVRPPADAPPAKAEGVDKVQGGDTWSRSLQCADHADRLARRKQVDYAKAPTETQLIDWSSHYNQRDARCFVELRFYNSPEARRGIEAGTPVFFSQLFDAVEGLEVAGTAGGGLDQFGTEAFCRISREGDRSTVKAENCAVSQMFIVDKMMK